LLGQSLNTFSSIPQETPLQQLVNHLFQLAVNHLYQLAHRVDSIKIWTYKCWRKIVTLWHRISSEYLS